MIRLTAAALMIAAPVWAMDPTASAPAIPCPAGIGLEAIAEPWEDNTASYAEGEVRLALLFLIDLHEYQLAILHPPRTELGTRQCHLVAPAEDAGYTQMRFDEHGASYDPERGLTITMPVQIGPETDDGAMWSDFYININLQTGDIRYQGFS